MTHDDDLAKSGKVYAESLPTDSRASFDKALKKLRRTALRDKCLTAYQDDLLWKECSRKSGKRPKGRGGPGGEPNEDELFIRRLVRDVWNDIRDRTPAEIRAYAKRLSAIAAWIETHDGRNTLGRDSSITDDVIVGLLGLDSKKAVA